MPNLLGETERCVKPIGRRHLLTSELQSDVPNAIRYAIDDTWRGFVLRWIDSQPRGAHARMARAARIAPATLTQILSGQISHTAAVPSINAMVGLAPPVTANGTVDEDDVLAQLAAARSQLSGADAGVFDEQLKSLLAMGRRLAQRRDRGGD